MLWRKLLMAGVSAPAVSTHWIIPGGRILTLKDGMLITVDPAAGWPQWSDAGDPFRDTQGRYGTYEQLNHGGGVGEARTIRLRDKGSDRQAPRSLGPYRGWASENVAIGMSSTGIGDSGNPFGYSRPSWSLSGRNGSTDTGATADWPWELQSNGTSSGQSTKPDHIIVIQSSYIPNMAYGEGVCVARDLGVVLRLAATAMTGDKSTDPGGRPWLGWTVDAAGTVRRIADLTPAQARQLGRDNGFVPPSDAVIEERDQSYGWEFLRPIAPVGLDAVLATGCLRYEESYVRRATTDERTYYTVGRPGYGTNHMAAPLEGTLNWYHAANMPPIMVTERRATYLFVTVLIRAGGIAQVGVTGSSVARSTRVDATASPSTGEPLAFDVYRRRDGSYDIVWEGHPQYRQFRYRGGTFPTEFVYSPNGWRTAIIWPAYSASGSVNDEVLVDHYMPVWFYSDSPTLGSMPPPKPDDWDEEEQGPWIEPPYDVDERLAWRGMRFWWPDEREWHWQTSQNDTYADSGRLGYVRKVNPLYPRGPYARDGVGQWYGRGDFVVARHQDGTLSAHEAGRIVPGIQSGPGGALDPHAERDGRNPVMRLLRWRGRPNALRMLQDGSWAYAANGRAWSAIGNLGLAQGTISVAATLTEPDGTKAREA